MKKIIYLAALVAAVTFTACNAKKTPEQLVNDVEAAYEAKDYQKALQLRDEAFEALKGDGFDKEQYIRLERISHKIPATEEAKYKKEHGEW
jgi:hypothetical protein